MSPAVQTHAPSVMLLLIKYRMEKIKAVPFPLSLPPIFFFKIFYSPFYVHEAASYFDVSSLSATVFSGNLTCLLGGVSTGAGLPF